MKKIHLNLFNLYIKVCSYIHDIHVSTLVRMNDIAIAHVFFQETFERIDEIQKILDTQTYLISVTDDIDALQFVSYNQLSYDIDHNNDNNNEVYNMLKHKLESDVHMTYTLGKISVLYLGISFILISFRIRGIPISPEYLHISKIPQIMDLFLISNKSGISQQIDDLLLWMTSPIPYCRPTLSTVISRFQLLQHHGKSFLCNAKLDTQSIYIQSSFHKNDIPFVATCYTNNGNTYLPIFVNCNDVDMVRYSNLNSNLNLNLQKQQFTLAIIPFHEHMTVQVIIRFVAELVPLTLHAREYELLYNEGCIDSLSTIHHLLKNNNTLQIFIYEMYIIVHQWEQFIKIHFHIWI